ncbi:ORF12 [White sturgeon adenovirus 1]|uniref:ORF12 n=1 Tax=White sturgeon adenovirus 1 TaxID=2580388 RepID=A0A4P8PNE9_9ADEN|nr:ORF12 [White sturgeon adenovirus 1]QCQ84190.1 ORF12 [White sturgeon adenovirus 1]
MYSHAPKRSGFKPLGRVQTFEFKYEIAEGVEVSITFPKLNYIPVPCPQKEELEVASNTGILSL